MSDLPAGLRQHIYQAHADGPRKNSRWIMNPEWVNEARKMTDSTGHALWHPSLSAGGADTLLGIPVEVRDDGGVPHLERK